MAKEIYGFAAWGFFVLAWMTEVEMISSDVSPESFMYIGFMWLTSYLTKKA